MPLTLSKKALAVRPSENGKHQSRQRAALPALMQKQICFRSFRPPHTVHSRPADSSLPRLPAALSSFSDTPAHNRPPSRTAEPLHQSRRPGMSAGARTASGSACIPSVTIIRGRIPVSIPPSGITGMYVRNSTTKSPAAAIRTYSAPKLTVTMLCAFNTNEIPSLYSRSDSHRSLVHEKYPDKELLFTEGCVEYSRFADSSEVAKAEMYAHDILGNLAAGTNGYLDWNLLLDELGGPNHHKRHRFKMIAAVPVECHTRNVFRRLLIFQNTPRTLKKNF